MTASVTARAPGKVNIQLSVGAVRDDGFHPLASVFHAVAMPEEVTVAAGAPGTGIVIGEVTGLQADEVPRDSTNLVWRAAERLAAELGRPSPDLQIAITKGVPVAGGHGRGVGGLRGRAGRAQRPLGLAAGARRPGTRRRSTSAPTCRSA